VAVQDATDGVLPIDKPAGVTSHDVVNVARRALGESRIGHAGTLDPFATGLLVLLVGSATRLLPHVSGDPKVYEATIRFGTETDTEDLLGTPTTAAPPPTRAAVDAAIATLVGELDQIPPAYSAKRVGGRRAYDLAREGAAVTLAPARVRVDAWEVLACRGADDAVAELDVRITCGGGTYIRSLARDLARAAGSAAHLASLRRLRSGAFDVADADSLDALRAGQARVQPALAALPHLAVQSLTSVDLRRVTSGIAVEAAVAGDWAALTSESSGELVALAERAGDRWQPRVVLREG
jgi:tRNA pseudouridine55 synthase